MTVPPMQKETYDVVTACKRVFIYEYRTGQCSIVFPGLDVAAAFMTKTKTGRAIDSPDETQLMRGAGRLHTCSSREKRATVNCRKWPILVS